MTTIDERLEAIAAKIEKDVRDDVANHVNGNKARDPYITRHEAKAAIRALFLDLIAEAKPEDYGLSHRGGELDEYLPAKLFDAAVTEYENNLIQAINGGKK